MIRYYLILFLLPLFLLGVHLILSQSIPEDYLIDSKMVFLNYFVLLLINLIAVFLVYINKRLKMMNFAGAFIIFTTIQMLACMSYALFIKLNQVDAKLILSHFLIGFFINLLFQSIILNLAQKRAKG